MTRPHMDDDRLEALLGDLDVVVWEADARSLAFRYVSPACERVLGRSAEALLDDPQAFAELVHPDDRPGVMAALLAADAGDARRPDAPRRDAGGAALDPHDRPGGGSW